MKTITIPKAFLGYVSYFERRLWFEIGWFPGEDFVLLSLQIGIVSEMTSLVSVLAIQLAYFRIGFGWETDA